MPSLLLNDALLGYRLLMFSISACSFNFFESHIRT
jgi:hypothetical protein